MPITKVLLVKRKDSTSPHPSASKRGDIAVIMDVGAYTGPGDHLGFQPVLREFADEADLEAFRQRCGKQVEDPAERMTVDLDDPALFSAASITASLDPTKALRPAGSPIPPPIVGRPHIPARNQIEATQTVVLGSSHTKTRRVRGIVAAPEPIE